MREAERHEEPQTSEKDENTSKFNFRKKKSNSTVYAAPTQAGPLPWVTPWRLRCRRRSWGKGP